MSYIYLRFKCVEICNYRCDFCHNEGIANLENTKYEMAPVFFDKILNQLTKLGLKKVKFTGGEPLMSENLFEYIDLCYKYKVLDIGMTTNGTNIGMISKILNKYPEFKFNLSVPAFNEKEYRKITKVDNYKNICELIDFFVNNKALFSINHIITNVDNLNLEFMENLDKLLVKASKIKLLIPCNTFANTIKYDSEGIQKKVIEFLLYNKAVVMGQHLNHIFFQYNNHDNLMICTPYCPDTCKIAHKHTTTLRLTPHNILKPCFLDNKFNIKLDELISDSELYDLFSKYIQANICCEGDLNHEY